MNLGFPKGFAQKENVSSVKCVVKQIKTEKFGFSQDVIATAMARNSEDISSQGRQPRSRPHQDFDPHLTKTSN